MQPTQIFREQHREILEIAGQINEHLSVQSLDENPKDVSKLLARLAGKLKGHLAMEDRALYPKLLAHEDNQINQTAARFQHEMGGIADTFGAYQGRWSSPDAIQASPKDFIVESKRLFSALSRRIDSEDNFLYKMLDEIQG